MKRHAPHTQGYASKYLFFDSLLPRGYMHEDKVCFDCEMFTSTGTLRMVTKDHKDLCLISVEQNVTYFLNSHSLSIMRTCCCSGEHTVIEDHTVAARCQAPAHLVQYKLYNVCIGSLLTAFILSSCGRTSERSPAHKWQRGMVPCCPSATSREGRCVSEQERPHTTYSCNMTAVSVKTHSSAKNLESWGRGSLADFCKVCFLQCLHKRGKAHLETEPAQAYWQIPEKERRG